jgi:ribonuclease J
MSRHQLAELPVETITFQTGDPSLPSRLISYAPDGLTVIPCHDWFCCGSWEATLQPGFPYEVRLEKRVRFHRGIEIYSYRAHQPLREKPSFFSDRFLVPQRWELTTAPKLEVIFLGGMAEAGSRACALLIHQGQALMVDCGLNVAALGRDEIQPDEEEVDAEDILALQKPALLPDFERLAQTFQEGIKLTGILVTHGHLDHYGGIPHLLERFWPDAQPPPIYSSPFTCSMLSHWAQQRGFSYLPMMPIKPGQELELGSFRVLPFAVPHSVMDALGFSIGVQNGPRTVFTGDLKVHYRTARDYFETIEILRGLPETRLLVCDSTNAKVPGWSGLEQEVEEGWKEVIARAPGRVIITFFATRLDRLKLAAELAGKFGKSIGVWGTSFDPVLQAGENRGLTLSLARQEVGNCEIVVVTGCQAQANSVAWGLGQGQTRGGIQIKPSDTIILSALPIPGRSGMVRRMLVGFLNQGSEVYIDFDHQNAPIVCQRTRTHVSGHGFQEDLRTILEILQPQFLVPYHGAPQAMAALAELASSPETNHRLAAENIVLFADNGGSIVL